MRIPNTPTSTIIQQSYQQWCSAEIMTRILNYQIFKFGSMSGRTQLDLGCTEVQHQPLPVHCSNYGRTFPEPNASKDPHTPTPCKVTASLKRTFKWGKHITVIIHPPLACKCFTPKRWWVLKDKPQVHPVDICKIKREQGMALSLSAECKQPFVCAITWKQGLSVSWPDNIFWDLSLVPNPFILYKLLASIQ